MTITLISPKNPIGSKMSTTFAASMKTNSFTDHFSELFCGRLRLRRRGRCSPRLARGPTLWPLGPSLVDEVPVQGVSRRVDAGLVPVPVLARDVS